MKTLKKLTLGVLAAGVMTSSALAYTPSAQVIHVAGSTAFRVGTSIAIIDALAKANTSTGAGTPTTSSTNTVYAAYVTSGKNVISDGTTIFTNGEIDGGTGTAATIIVECDWTGSLTGCVDLVAGKSFTTFIDETNSNVQAAIRSSNAAIPAGTYGTGALISGSGVLKASGDTVQLAMSDSNKATVAKELATASLSGTIGSYSTIGALAAAVSSLPSDAGSGSYAGGAGTVGIVPFQWFLGNYSVTPSYVPTNLSQQQAAVLFTNGFLPQASFTGTNNGGTDETTTFYLVGRNEDSGTRIGALAESQFGVTGSPVQFVLGNDSNNLTGSWSVATAGGGTATGSGVAAYPAGATLNYEPALYWPTAGHSGYAKGSQVQAALNQPSTGTNGIPPSSKGGDGGTSAAYFIGYVGLTDGNVAATSATPATALTYNGVPFSNQAVANGSYTFWTYEHAYYNSGASYTTLQTNVVNLIADLIFYRDADSYPTTSPNTPGPTTPGTAFTVSYAEQTLGSGVYTANPAPGQSPGNAGLLDDFGAGVTASRGLEGTPVISGF